MLPSLPEPPPAAPPRWEGHAPEPLTQQALTALAAQDAATHDQHLRLLRFDDRMAELVSVAAWRGRSAPLADGVHVSLARFLTSSPGNTAATAPPGPVSPVRPAGQPIGPARALPCAHHPQLPGAGEEPRSELPQFQQPDVPFVARRDRAICVVPTTHHRQLASHALCTLGPQAEVVVEAPEFLTVEYLKRRVARAKLQRGEVSGRLDAGRGLTLVVWWLVSPLPCSARRSRYCREC